MQSVYDLLAVARWRFAPADSDGGEDGQIDPEKLPPAERKAWYDSEHRRRDLQVRDRELIPKDEAAVAIATAFSAVAQAVRSLPDHLERRYALAPDVVGGVEQALNDALDELADRLSAISPVDNDDSD